MSKKATRTPQNTARVRRPKPLHPFDPSAAAVLLEALRAGRGLDAGMRRAGITQRTVFAWLAHGGRKGDDPVLEPYRRFRAEYVAIVVNRT